MRMRQGFTPSDLFCEQVIKAVYYIKRYDMPREKLLTQLKKDARFAEFNEDELKKLLDMCHVTTYKANEVILKEGNIGDKFFIVADGEVGISKEISNQVVFFITTLKTGDVFGEMSLISNVPRSATAYASREATLLSMDKKNFEKLKAEDGKIFASFTWMLAKTLSDRLYKVEDRLTKILSASLSETII